MTFKKRLIVLQYRLWLQHGTDREGTWACGFVSRLKSWFSIIVSTQINRSFQYTGLFEMIIGVLTTCHTKYTWDRSIYCTDVSRKSQSFLLWCAVCCSYEFLRLEGIALRWRQRHWGDLCASISWTSVSYNCPAAISFYEGTSRIRFMFLHFPQVSRNWRYESEPSLQPSQLTCYKQFGTCSIIVLMFVESKAPVRYATKTWRLVLLNTKTYSPISSVLYMTSC
jgi:hypothetical protein